MDWVEPKTNFQLSRMIQDWIIQSWITRQPDSNYNAALVTTLQSLWPNNASTGDNKEKPSYFPFPSLCCQALGGYSIATIAVNASWVLLYMASYLLDKIEDHEAEHPIFLKFDRSVVTNLSTGLILHAERILTELEPDNQTDVTTIDIIRKEFNRKALIVCAGQHQDLTIKAPSFTQIWKIVDGKSGQFFSLAAFLGARLATNDASKVEVFSYVDRCLGILIQIANDIQGLGKEKEIGSDLASGKRTLPVLYALQVLTGDKHARLVELLAAAVDDQSAEIEARRMIISAGVIVYLSLEAEKYRQRAIQSLTQLGFGVKSISSLIDLLDYAGHKKPKDGIIVE